MANNKRFTALCLFFFLASLVYSEDTQVKDSKIEHVGFIFSADNILLDLDDYNGGVGVKLMLSGISLRFLADFGYSNSTKLISADLGAAFEKSIRSGRISPYFGAGFQVGIEHETAEIDADNWVKDITIPFEASCFLGVELFLLEFLSVFAEYSVAVNVNGVVTTESIGGSRTTVSNWNWDVGTGLGNSGRLGIVIYLDNVVEIERN